MQNFSRLLFLVIAILFGSDVYAACTVQFEPLSGKLICVTSGGSGSGDVSGGSSLTTAGAVPYVASAGVLTQAPTGLFYDSANVRLGVGTGSPSHRLHSYSTGNGTQVLGYFQNANAGNPAVVRIENNSTQLNVGLDSDNMPVFALGGTDKQFNFKATLSGTNLMRLMGTGNLLLGTTTDDGSSKLQVAGHVIVNAGNALRLQNAAANQYASMALNASSVVTLNYSLSVGPSSALTSGVTFGVHDGTPTTGSTSLVVRAGAGQSGNLTTWQNSSGTEIASIGSVGNFIGTSDVAAGSAWSIYWTGRAVLKSPADSVITLLNQAQTDFNRLQFGGTTSSFPALKRSSAILQARLADDSAFAQFQAKDFIYSSSTEATCNSTVRGTVTMVQGSSGVADTFRVCAKDSSDVYSWIALF